jgi:hypothetical protein
MPADPGLTRDDHTVSKTGTSSDSALGYQQTTFSEPHIMGYLNQIVDLGSSSDSGLIQ